MFSCRSVAQHAMGWEQARVSSFLQSEGAAANGATADGAAAEARRARWADGARALTVLPRLQQEVVNARAEVGGLPIGQMSGRVERDEDVGGRRARWWAEERGLVGKDALEAGVLERLHERAEEWLAEALVVA